MKIAVVGATGMVGTVMLKVLEERNLPITEFIPVASERSAGKKLSYKGKEYTIVTLADALKMKPDIALFSAGGDTSMEWAPKFAEVGTTVVIILLHGEWILPRNWLFQKLMVMF